MYRATGFTLLELMIVVALIAILLVIGFSSSRNSRKSANETSCIAFFKQAVIANEQYAVRYDIYPPSFNDMVTTGYFASGQNPSGYQLTYIPGVNDWSFQGSPQLVGETGDRYFYVDQMGVIRFDLAAAANSTSTPIE